MIEAEAFRRFIKICSLLKIELVSTNINLVLHKALIWSIMTYACPAWELAADQRAEIAAPAKQSSPHRLKFSKVHTLSQIAHGFQTSIHI
jgi:hypothetical protein